MGKVLIVDDEEEILCEVAECLEFAGFDTLPFGSAAEALDALRQNDDIQVVVTDLKMPVMDGIEMLRQARSEGLLEDKAIILVSGHLLEVELDMGLIDAVVSKPIEIDHLVDVVNGYLKR